MEIKKADSNFKGEILGEYRMGGHSLLFTVIISYILSGIISNLFPESIIGAPGYGLAFTWAIIGFIFLSYK